MQFWKNFSEAKKNFLKPLVLASSLVLWNPSEAIASEISENCGKISKILVHQKEIDDLIFPEFENVNHEKFQKFENFTNNFCEKPVWVWFEKNLEEIAKNLEIFEKFSEKISESVKNLSEVDRFNLTFFKKSVENFSEDEKKFFYEFLNIQKNFLADVENFSKNFSKEDFISWNLVYKVNSWDSFFEIIKKTLNTKKAEKVHRKISEINEWIKNWTLNKNKIIKRSYSYNKNKSVTFLDIWDKIDFWYLMKKWILESDPEFSEEILKKYWKWFLLEMYIKWNNFPLNLDRNRIYDVARWVFMAYCAWSMYQFTSDVYSAEYPISHDFDLDGQSNAYKIINQVLRNWWEILDTWWKSIWLYAISEKNLEKYWNEQNKKVTLKVAKKDSSEYKKNWWKLEPNKNNAPYLKFSKYFKTKKLEKKWWELREPGDRIIQMEDWRWVWLKKKSLEEIKEKTIKIYKQAEKNPWSLIFWHYTLTWEIYKIILEHYNRHLEKNTLSEEELQYQAASYWSHYTFNAWRQTVDYSLYKLQNLSQKWENLPHKNVDTSKKITLQDAISTVIPWWDKEISDDFMDKEEIFKKVKISVKTENWKYWATLYDFWKNDYDLEEYILKKDDILEIEDVYVFDEYLWQWRFIPLTKLLCEFEDNAKSNNTFSNFIPTSIVKIPDEYKKWVIPEYIKKIENTSWLQFAWIDSPQAFVVWEVDAKKIWKNVQRPFSVSEINKIYNYYNKNFAWKNWNEKAVRNRKTWKVTEWENLIFFLNWWKIQFVKQEKNFDELFERWVKEGIYKESDKVRVKYFLEKIWAKEVSYWKINWTVKFPIFKFTWSWKISEEASLMSNSDEFELRNVSEINKIWERKWIEFLENITQEDVENVKKVTKDSYEQSILLSMKWFETWSWEFASFIEEWAAIINDDLAWTIWDFQINLIEWIEVFWMSFRAWYSNLNSKLKTNFNEKIFKIFKNKFSKYLKEDFESDLKILKINKEKIRSWKLANSYENKVKWTSKNFKNFKDIIKDFILNDDTKFLAWALFIKSKENIIFNNAKKFYWDEFYSEVLKDSNFISYKDNLKYWSFDTYKWMSNEIFIMWQSYILNKIFYWNEKFSHSEIQQKIDKNFHEKFLKVLKENSEIVKKLWIKYTEKSIEKSLKWYDNKWNYVYTWNLNRIFWWDGFKWDLFRKSMWESEAENAFQILKKIYKKRFWQLPPLFMDEKFRENFKYGVEWKNTEKIKHSWSYINALYKWKWDIRMEHFRSRNIKKIQKMILKAK